MYFCKSRKHVWSRKDDSEKCCNGFKRITVSGSDIPEDAINVQINPETGIRFARVWEKEDPNEVELHPSLIDLV